MESSGASRGNASLKRALEACDIDIDPGDDTLRRLLRMLARSLGADEARMTVVHESRVFSLASHPSTPDLFTPARDLLCQQVAESGEAHVVRDAGSDIVWSQHPLFADTLRAYAGVPVYGSGLQVVGAVSIMSRKPLADREDEIVASLLDAAAVIQDRIRLRGEAVHDGLTQLFNRRVFDKRADVEWRRAMRQGEAVSVALLDIDHFKAFNDTAGHAAGDRALVEISRLLLEQMKRAGDLVCRYGGEEFVILMPATDGHGAMVKMDRVRQAIEAAGIEHPAYPDQKLAASIGIASAQGKENLLLTPPSRCLEQADAALYEAKSSGRNRVCLYEGGGGLVAQVRARALETHRRNAGRNVTAGATAE